MFKFNEAVSLQVICEQPGRDRLLLGQALGGRRSEGAAVRLAEGQVRPVVAGRARAAAPDLFKDHASRKAERAMEAMLRMKKIDIAELERAAAEEPVGRRS